MSDLPTHCKYCDCELTDDNRSDQDGLCLDCEWADSEENDDFYYGDEEYEE